jgi:O-antigen/teichoic acid export membrane protein
MIFAAKELLSRSRRHLGSAWWSSVEYLFYPVLMIAAVPALVTWTGTEGFGLLMLVNAIGGMGAAANFGMSGATVKFVSARLGDGDRKGAADVVRTTLAIGLAASISVAVLIAIAASWMALTLFQKMGDPETVTMALWCAAVLLVLSQADGVFSAIVKGHERFELAAKLEIACKLLIVSGNIVAAWAWHRVDAVLTIMVILVAAAVGVKALVASRLLGNAVMWPRWGDRVAVGSIMGFGAWGWVQGMAATLFAYADRLLVGALLGASALSYYSVCIQLAQQIHAVPAAAMSFLFPFVSRRLREVGPAGVDRARRYGILANVGLSLGLGGLMLAFGPSVLAIWMGDAFAQQSAGILPWLTFSFFLLSLSVAPYYLLLGHSQVRYMSLANLAGSGIGLFIAWLLMPFLGLVGAAFARVALGAAMLSSYWKLFTLKTAS